MLLWLRQSLPYLGLHCQRRDQRELSKTDLGKLAGLCSGPASGNWVRSDVQKLILPPHSGALSEAVNLGRPEGTRSDLRKNSVSYLLVHICWALQMEVSKKNSSQKSLTNILACLFTRLILTFTKGSNTSRFLGTLSWFLLAFLEGAPSHPEEQINLLPSLMCIFLKLQRVAFTNILYLYHLVPLSF